MADRVPWGFLPRGLCSRLLFPIDLPWQEARRRAEHMRRCPNPATSSPGSRAVTVQAGRLAASGQAYPPGLSGERRRYVVRTTGIQISLYAMPGRSGSKRVKENMSDSRSCHPLEASHSP